MVIKNPSDPTPAIDSLPGLVLLKTVAVLKEVLLRLSDTLNSMIGLPSASSVTKYAFTYSFVSPSMTTFTLNSLKSYVTSMGSVFADAVGVVEGLLPVLSVFSIYAVTLFNSQLAV